MCRYCDRDRATIQRLLDMKQVGHMQGWLSAEDIDKLIRLVKYSLEKRLEDSWTDHSDSIPSSGSQFPERFNPVQETPRES